MHSLLAFGAALPLTSTKHKLSTSMPRPRQTRSRPLAKPKMLALSTPSRRDFMLHTPVLAVVASTLSGSMHSELSELASKIPGAGMPDVYYPDFFQGEWLVARDLYAVETPAEGKTDAPAHATLGRQAIQDARERIGIRQSFLVHFVQHGGHVIEDRGANEHAETVSSFPLQRVTATWDRDNPNLLRVTRSPLPGTKVTREVKVTKRAFVDGPLGYGTFVTSEYARVVDAEGEGSLVGFGKPPSIYGRRRIMRYKVSSVSNELQPDGIDRIVVDYLYPPSPPDAKAAVVLKYRDFLNRKRKGPSLT